MLIHTETGNVYFDGYNTYEPIYEFLLSLQDEKKRKINTTLSYCDTFSNHLGLFLDDIDQKTFDKYDIFTNKNVKHLFYRFNNVLLFRGQPKLTVRHSKRKNCR